MVDRLITKRNCNFAITDKDKVYTWGQLAKGVNFKTFNQIVDIPEKNETLQGYSFNEFALSQDSAVGIARSVMLNIQIPDPEESESEMRPRYSASTVTNKKDGVTFVSVHAIPVFDGHFIQSQNDIHEALIEQGEMQLDLINDFEIPWVKRKPTNYPKYRRVRRKPRALNGE